jgi:hydrogenase maturation protease
MTMHSYAIVGLGTLDRGDDAVGLVVAERLAEEGLRVVRVDAPLDLLDVFDGHDTVLVVDATQSGAVPGTVTVSRGSRFVHAAGSTHGLGLIEAVELARALDRLPARLLVVGIEIGDTTAGAPLSAPVAAALDEAVERVRECLAVTQGGV